MRHDSVTDEPRSFDDQVLARKKEYYWYQNSRFQYWYIDFVHACAEIVSVISLEIPTELCTSHHKTLPLFLRWPLARGFYAGCYCDRSERKCELWSKSWERHHSCEFRGESQAALTLQIFAVHLLYLIEKHWNICFLFVDNIYSYLCSLNPVIFVKMTKKIDIYWQFLAIRNFNSECLLEILHCSKQATSHWNETSLCCVISKTMPC